MNTKTIESNVTLDDLPADIVPKLKKKRKPRTKKTNNLSADEVRKNHVVSEKRRRELVRAIYDDLVNFVPDLQASENRSEIIIYLKTMNYLKWLYQKNASLRNQIIEKYASAGQGKEIPKHLVWELNVKQNIDIDQDSSENL